MTGHRERRLALGLALALAACGDATPAAPLVRSEDARPAASTAPVVVARIEQLAGDVEVQPSGAERWERARVGQTLGPGDSVQAMSGASARLRLVPSGARLDVDAGTTLRMPDAVDDVARVRPLMGRIVARTGAQPIALQLPPGTLVLDPHAGADVEAVVELHGDASSVEMTQGEGVLARTGGERVAMHAHHWTRFDARGEVAGTGELGPVAEPLEPADGATLETRGDVTFRWASLPGATAYRVVLERDGVVRTLERDDTTLTTTLVPGTFRWSVAGVHDGSAWPASPQRTLTIVADHTPPALAVTSPVGGAITRDGVVHVEGRTEPLAQVEALGVRVRADATGRFALAASVERGLTNVVVRATDASGNVRATTRTVVRE